MCVFDKNDNNVITWIWDCAITLIILLGLIALFFYLIDISSVVIDYIVGLFK